jgi:enoyl reductase-like protein
MRHDEGHRHVGERQAGFPCHRDQLFDDLEAALIRHLPGHEFRPQRVGHRLALAVLAGKHALGQRTPHHHTHAVALAGRQHVTLDASVQNGVRRLFRAEASEPAALCYPLCLDDL